MPKPVNKQKTHLAHQPKFSLPSILRLSAGDTRQGTDFCTCLTSISESVVAEARGGFWGGMDETTVPAETTLATGEEFADLCHGVDLSPTDRAKLGGCEMWGGQPVVGEETPVAVYVPEQ